MPSFDRDDPIVPSFDEEDDLIVPFTPEAERAMDRLFELHCTQPPALALWDDDARAELAELEAVLAAEDARRERVRRRMRRRLASGGTWAVE